MPYGSFHPLGEMRRTMGTFLSPESNAIRARKGNPNLRVGILW